MVLFCSSARWSVKMYIADRYPVSPSLFRRDTNRTLRARIGAASYDEVRGTGEIAIVDTFIDSSTAPRACSQARAALPIAMNMKCARCDFIPPVTTVVTRNWLAPSSGILKLKRILDSTCGRPSLITLNCNKSAAGEMKSASGCRVSRRRDQKDRGEDP